FCLPSAVVKGAALLGIRQAIRAWHPRVSARWLQRYLEECGDVTIAEVVMVASCLATLAGRTGSRSSPPPQTPAPQIDSPHTVVSGTIDSETGGPAGLSRNERSLSESPRPG